MKLGHSIFVGVVWAALSGATPVLAETAGRCSCENLESLQQDYQNAVYLETFYRDLAKSLGDWEATQFKLVKDPNNPVNVSKASRARELAAAKDTLVLPFPQITGQTGLMSVEMAALTCIHLDGQLADLEAGAPCQGIAAAELERLRQQRELCTKMGSAAYWDRPGSAFAEERAESYKKKSATLKAELGDALDRAEITVRGDWPYTVTMPGMEMSYTFEFVTTDFGKSASDATALTFTAEGESRHSMTGMAIEGLNCSASGTVVHEFSVRLTTDGLTFGLEFAGELGGGEHSVTCEGNQVPLPPAVGSGWGQFSVSRLPLKVGESDLPTNWTGALTPFAMGGVMGMMSGVSVTGQAKSVLRVQCSKP